MGAPRRGDGIEPRITVITLAVGDLERAVGFYRDGLGWPTDGIIGTEFEDGAVAFFRLSGGPILALWPRESLARDASLPPGPRSSTELTLGHNLASAEAVDRAFAIAVAAGGTPVKAPRATSWGGYAGYLADPDGHLWELVFNSDLIPD